MSMFSWLDNLIDHVFDWFKDPEPSPPPKPPRCPGDEDCDRNDHDQNSPYVLDKYEYNKRLWDSMEYRYLGKQKPSHITWTVNKIRKGVARYESGAKLFYRRSGQRVPWQVIAILHMREASGSFKKQIMNGQKWTRVTTWVPKNYGPWSSWEESCNTALAIKNLPQKWTIENTLHFFERWNGMGYAMYRRDIVGFTPYNWAFTNHYQGGYYTSDGHFDKDALAMGVGCAVLLKELGFKGEE